MFYLPCSECLKSIQTELNKEFKSGAISEKEEKIKLIKFLLYYDELYSIVIDSER